MSGKDPMKSQNKRRILAKWLPLSTSLMLLWAADGLARDVFLNGTDISSAKNQKLKNVTVQIDAHGNVYIEAKHYQVHDQSAYLPLSSYMQNVPQPQNTAPLTLPGHDGKPVHVPNANTQMNLEKTGSKAPVLTSESMIDSPAAENPPEVGEVQSGDATAH